MTQPYPPQQPGWTPPPPPKKTPVGKIIGLGCAGIIGLFIVIGIISALASSGNDTSKDKATVSTTPAVKDTGAAKSASSPAAKEPEKSPVTVTAKKTAFSKTILATGSDYTSVQVTISNDSGDSIDVNPLYITITDTTGAKHTAELGVDEKQIGTVTLAPGENVTGTVTGKGTFTAKYVTYTDGFIGDPVRGDVS